MSYAESRARLIASRNRRFHAFDMLGLHIESWMRFFLWGFIAGLLLYFVPFTPISSLAVVEMILASCGMIVVTIYARSYTPREWRRWLVRAHRLAQTMSQLRAMRRQPRISP